MFFCDFPAQRTLMRGCAPLCNEIVLLQLLKGSILLPPTSKDLQLDVQVEFLQADFCRLVIDAALVEVALTRRITSRSALPQLTLNGNLLILPTFALVVVIVLYVLPILLEIMIPLILPRRSPRLLLIIDTTLLRFLPVVLVLVVPRILRIVFPISHEVAYFLGSHALLVAVHVLLAAVILLVCLAPLVVFRVLLAVAGLVIGIGILLGVEVLLAAATFLTSPTVLNMIKPASLS